MVLDGKLDRALMQAMRSGPAALPADLGVLGRYLSTIDTLLAEKADAYEEDWFDVCEAAAEIDTLQQLETSVAERSIAVPADTLEAVLAKFEIWRALEAGADETATGDSLRDRIVRSIEEDVVRIARRAAQ